MVAVVAPLPLPPFPLPPVAAASFPLPFVPERLAAGIGESTSRAPPKLPPPIRAPLGVAGIIVLSKGGGRGDVLIGGAVVVVVVVVVVV